MARRPVPVVSAIGMLWRLQKHLLSLKDLDLIILKGHLIVEEEMDELIEIVIPSPEYLYKARFGFLQRLRVLQAVYTAPEFRAIVPALELLNELRNSLAHHLEPEKFKTHLPAFITAAFGADPRITHSAIKPSFVEREKSAPSVLGVTLSIAVVVGTFNSLKLKQLKLAPSSKHAV